MALEGINTTQFDAFVAFARGKLAERDEKSVARLSDGGSSRIIAAADPRHDSVHKFWRNDDEKTENNQARRVFRKAVAESNTQFSRFDGLVAEALGNDMSNYQGLDFEEEIVHDQDVADAICGDFLATIAKNPEAYEPNWG